MRCSTSRRLSGVLLVGVTAMVTAWFGAAPGLAAPADVLTVKAFYVDWGGERRCLLAIANTTELPVKAAKLATFHDGAAMIIGPIDLKPSQSVVIDRPTTSAASCLALRTYRATYEIDGQANETVISHLPPAGGGGTPSWLSTVVGALIGFWASVGSSWFAHTLILRREREKDRRERRFKVADAYEEFLKCWQPTVVHADLKRCLDKLKATIVVDDEIGQQSCELEKMLFHTAGSLDEREAAARTFASQLRQRLEALRA